MALWFLLRGVLCSLQFVSALFSIVITSLGEKRAGLYGPRAFVYLSCIRCFLSLFSSSWYQGLAVANDCGTPWLLTFYVITSYLM